MHSASGKGRRNQGEIHFSHGRTSHVVRYVLMFRVIGKYIDESGLDVEYSAVQGFMGHTQYTLAGILAGKHVKRCVYTYMTLYPNIMDIMLDDFLLKDPEPSVAVKTITTRYLLLVILRYDDDIKALHEDLVSELTKIYSLFSEHRKGLPGKVLQ